MNDLAAYFWILLPIVLAAVCNMLWVRLPAVRRFNRPMDADRLWRDGRPLLGAHKTWFGFMGMPAWSAAWMAVFSMVNARLTWTASLDLFGSSGWTISTALVNGAVWGIGYVLAELPNSFIKRRLDIGPGQTAGGLKGLVFTFWDQADSVIGCLLTMHWFYRPAPAELLLLFVLGTAIHYLVNVALFLLGLKNQMG